MQVYVELRLLGLNRPILLMCMKLAFFRSIKDVLTSVDNVGQFFITLTQTICFYI